MPKKGGAVVTIEAKDYFKETEHRLNDKDNYRIFLQDPTIANNKLVNQATDRFKIENLRTDSKISETFKTPDP